MIEFIDASKTFNAKSGIVHAVKDINLKIHAHEIFGVIGYSGAGKSTLIRMINLLEKPTTGKILIEDQDMMGLSSKDLRNRRKKIGMIFQQFNLMASRTVTSNIELAIKKDGKSKEEIQKKISDLLELVEISDKANAYPSQLSGGQKQRVAIARALANDPDILLCDEATSALDPQTTHNILKLLKNLNKTLKITIVLITHEMAVIKEVCDRVAVMEDGRIVEMNDVTKIFSEPQSLVTKEFVDSSSNVSHIEALLDDKSSVLNLKAHELLLRVDFFGPDTSQATISYLSKTFNLDASIIFANVEVIKNEIMGSMIIILAGKRDDQDSAIEYLKLSKIKVEVLRHGPLV